MERQSHAVFEPTSRYKKAEKIAWILSARRPLAGAKLLDVGTGSGLLAEYFMRLVGPDGSVEATDKKNQLSTDIPIAFRAVEDGSLPYEDNRFDIVLSNHVIEHAGETADQLYHVQEVARILRPDGVAFFAFPNRWTPFEPHFKLPLLSWLPKQWRSSYVRIAGRGSHYDCELLTRPHFLSITARANVKVEDVTAEALKIYLTHEAGALISKAAWLPDSLINVASRLWCIPSLAFLVRK